MSSKPTIEAFAEEVGAPSAAELCASYLIASWFEELMMIHSGEASAVIIPQGTRGRLREVGAFRGGVGCGSHLKVDVGRVESLASAPWLPDYEPGPYIPEVSPEEMNVYHPIESVSTVEPKTLADMLPPEEEASLPEPEPINHGGHDLRGYLGEDAETWRTIQEAQNDKRRRYRRL